MGRIRKWGSRRARVPNLGRLRLPKLSWDSIPRATGRSPAFKARPSRDRIPRLAGRSPAFKAKPAKAVIGLPVQGAQYGVRRSRTPFRLFRRHEQIRTDNISTVRGQKPGKRRRFWIIFSLLFILAVLQGLRYVEQHLKPPILHLAQIRVKQIATEAINKAIGSQVADTGNAEELIDWKTDKNGKISGFMLNYKEHMRITSQAAEVIQSTLQQLRNQTEHIPLGQALGSSLIASYGPDVPIKIEPQGAVKVELNTRQKDAGINMILVEVYIHIVTEVAVVIPFDMKPQVVDTEIPVSYLMVVGDVPMYYYDNQGQPVGANGSSAPGIAIPAPPASEEKSGNTEKDTSVDGGGGNDSTPGSGTANEPSSNSSNAANTGADPGQQGE